jgi:hypothetical protein
LDTRRGERHLIALVCSTTRPASAPGVQGLAERFAAATDPAIATILKTYDAKIAPLFPAAAAPQRAAAPAAPAFPSVYNRVVAKDQSLDTIAKELRALAVVEAALCQASSRTCREQDETGRHGASRTCVDARLLTTPGPSRERAGAAWSAGRRSGQMQPRQLVVHLSRATGLSRCRSFEGHARHLRSTNVHYTSSSNLSKW